MDEKVLTASRGIRVIDGLSCKTCYKHVMKNHYLSALLSILLCSGCATKKYTASFQNVHFDRYEHRSKRLSMPDSLRLSRQDSVIITDLVTAVSKSEVLKEDISKRKIARAIKKSLSKVDLRGDVKDSLVVQSKDPDVDLETESRKLTRAKGFSNLGFGLVLLGVGLFAFFALNHDAGALPTPTLMILAGGLMTALSKSRLKKHADEVDRGTIRRNTFGGILLVTTLVLLVILVVMFVHLVNTGGLS